MKIMVTIEKKWRFMAVYLKVNPEIAERLDISCPNSKIVEIKMLVTTVVIRLDDYCRKPGYIKQNCLKLNKRDSQLKNNQYILGNSNSGNHD
jgi:hypothetical protein